MNHQRAPPLPELFFSQLSIRSARRHSKTRVSKIVVVRIRLFKSRAFKSRAFKRILSMRRRAIRQLFGSSGGSDYIEEHSRVNRVFRESADASAQRASEL